MELTATEIGHLTRLAGKETTLLRDLRETAKSKPSLTTRVISSLEEKGFVNTARSGHSKMLSISQSRHAMLFRDMALEYPHLDLAEILDGKSLEVLSAIAYTNPGTRKEICKNGQVSEASAGRVLLRLRRRGIVQKKEGGYLISPRFVLVKKFVMEFRHYLNYRKARNFAGDAVMVWERNDEFIIESMSREVDKNGFLLTGPSLFARFGVVLFMKSSYHFFSPRAKRVRLEDSILHSLLVQPSRRTMLSILLVWKKNQQKMRKKYLYSEARRYGIKSKIQHIEEYLDTKGKKRELPELPKWNEFASKAREYDIKP